jgi:hypothetical protein
LNDPLSDVEPAQLTPPSHRPPCPTCGAPLVFAHHDAAPPPPRWMPGARLLGAEFVVIGPLIAVVAAVGAWVGAVPALVVLAVGGWFAYRWIQRRIDARAVWRCVPCDALFKGAPLRPWQR